MMHTDRRGELSFISSTVHPPDEQRQDMTLSTTAEYDDMAGHQMRMRFFANNGRLNNPNGDGDGDGELLKSSIRSAPPKSMVDVQLQGGGGEGGGKGGEPPPENV